ncbi:MAG TPA: IPT/TIG domain-containing protein [Bryobacteraceae bacterium]|nr:IPT/TIG domain-containing protein [Bryobacteraceae bacterium]
MKLKRTFLFLAAAISFPAAAQVWDNTGNSKLNGQYYFREVFFTSTDAVAVYGGMSFGGNGTYNINATALDCNQQSCSGPSPYTTSGTYSISASGYGFLSNQLLQSPVYGLVGMNGIFVGSSTESGANDIFIAAPISSQNTGTLQGSYSLAYIYPDAQTPFDALLQMSPNGAGTIGTVGLTAYATSSSPTTQSISGVKYIVSNNAFVVTFPNSSSNLVTGQEYLYSSPDGTFVFGGSPQDFDMFVGVRTGTSGSGFGGLYYQAGIEIDNSQLASTGNNYLSTLYGSFNANNGVILGHQRIQDGQGAYGYTYQDSYSPGTTGSYNDSFLSTQFIGANGGATQIGLGIGPYIGISVAFQAPTFSGSGVYLNPVGVVNSASYAPFTAGVSRGEYITLNGTNLGSSTLQVASTVPFPTTLGGVQVLINNVAAPIYYVSSNQVAALVPYETTASVAQIQVMNNGAPSNAITEFVNQTTPGVFTQGANGIGYAAAGHQDGSVITPSNPAQIGETINVYVTGLGDVFPSIADGTAAAVNPLSTTSNTITADIAGVAAPVYYSGLAPGYVGLYQLDVLVPSGVSTGDNYLDISAPDSETSQALIPVGSGSTAMSSAARGTRSTELRPRKAMVRPHASGNRAEHTPFPEQE